MSFWTPDNIRSVTGGTWLARPTNGAAPPQISGLSTDTRTIRAGQVFLAIKGDTHDGHKHLAAATRAGSPLTIVNEGTDPAPAGPGAYVLAVPDTRKALARLAAAYRKTLETTRVVAVAGSNGKTTTVRLIDAVLSRRLKGTASIKSFNNSIGVPLTILGARPGDKYLICEVGTNAPGEIAELAEIVRPDIGVIVSIGREHLERLGTLRDVCREETTLLRYLRPGGLAVVNIDAAYMEEMLRTIPGLGGKSGGPDSPSLITFGSSDKADVRVTGIRDEGDGLSVTLNERRAYAVPLIGRHNALNAAAAVAVGRRFGIEEEHIAAGLASVRGAEMRMERSTAGGITILNDAYNANPDSMRAGLETLKDAAGARRVAVLGDMLELGGYATEAHSEVGRTLREWPSIDLVVLVGPLMRHAAEELKQEIEGGRALHVPDLDGPAASRVAGSVRSGDTVLVKGSRGMRLERVVAAIREKHAPPAAAGSSR